MPSLKISPPSSASVQLNVETVQAPDGELMLVIKHQGTCLDEHDDGLEIRLDGSDSVTVEMLDFEDDNGSWMLSATPRGNASPLDPAGDTWERSTNLCRTSWEDTSDEEVEVVVTATNGASAARPKPIFIKVLREEVRPWD